MTTVQASNPLIEHMWEPLPDFSAYNDSHFAPALEYVLQQARENISQLCSQKEPPTIENTVVALERIFTSIHNVSSIFYHLHSAHTNDTLDTVAEEYAPLFSQFYSDLYQNSQLYKRIETLHQDSELPADTARLVNDWILDFRSHGTHLSQEDKQTIREYDSELSTLTTRVQKLCSKAMHNAGIWTNEAPQGLSEEQLETARQAGIERNNTGGTYFLGIVYPSQPPLLANLDDASIRAQLLATSLARCSSEDTDTTELIARIARIRLRRAQLLGYPSHADYILSRNTAPGTQEVTELLHTMSQHATRKAHKELAQLTKYAGQAITASDWIYFQEKLRAQDYQVNNSQLAHYFPLHKVLTDGVFYSAHKLYGITFTPTSEITMYHNDVTVWKVHSSSGELIGYYALDPFTRETKRGGAWMNTVRDQSHEFHSLPVVFNTLNVEKNTTGESYLSPDQVITLFHECGHALHALLSNVRHISQSGTNVPRDFVEFPSQINELWAWWPEVISHYTEHKDTKQPIPEELIHKLQAVQTFGEGFATYEFLAAAVIDWAWHSIRDEKELDLNWEEFEHNALNQAGLTLEEIPPRYRSPYFQHIFAGGYSAGYYGYLWSEILDANAAEWFTTHGGLTTNNGEQFAEAILRGGNSKDPMESFIQLLGHEPTLAPLMARKGF